MRSVMKCTSFSFVGKQKKTMSLHSNQEMDELIFSARNQGQAPFRNKTFLKKGSRFYSSFLSFWDQLLFLVVKLHVHPEKGR